MRDCSFSISLCNHFIHRTVNCCNTDLFIFSIASELGSAVVMQTMRSSVSTDQLAMIYALEAPYTVALISPQIDMAFSTNQGIMAREEISASLCSFAITEPTVIITIK